MFEDAVTTKKWKNNVPTEAFRVLGNGQIFLEVRLVKQETESTETLQVFVEEFGRTRVVRVPVNPKGEWICRKFGVDASQVVWLRSRRVLPTEEVLSVNNQDVFRITRRLQGGSKGQPSAYKQGTLLKAKGRLSGLLIGKGAQQGAVSNFVELVISKAGEAHLVQLAGNKQEPVLWRQLQETVEKFGLEVESLKPCTLKPAAATPKQGGDGGNSRANFSVDLRDFALEGLFKNRNDEAVAFHRTWSCLNRGVSVVELHELETVMQRGKFLCVDECTVLTLSRPVSHPKFETGEVVLPCKDVEGRTGLVRVFATHLGEQKALLGNFRDKEITLPDTSVVQFTLYREDQQCWHEVMQHPVRVALKSAFEDPNEVKLLDIWGRSAWKARMRMRLQDGHTADSITFLTRIDEQQEHRYTSTLGRCRVLRNHPSTASYGRVSIAKML